MANTETNRSGVHFNLFDVILILVIVGCIAGLALHAYFTKELSETYSDSASISFTVSGVSENTAAAFCKSGSTLYLQESDEKLGTLNTASFDAQILELENSEGILVKAAHPEKKEIKANATFIGTWTDDGFLIGGKTLASIGKTLKIYTENAVCTITITGVLG